MTKQQRMAQRILNHGFDLRSIFFDDPYSIDPYISPLAIAKALHRIEARMHRMAEEWCNGTVTEEQVDKAEASALKAIKRLLPKVADGTIPIYFNHDPRGYALKIPSEYVAANNLDIHRDWGGYGILAPEFDGRP